MRKISLPNNKKMTNPFIRLSIFQKWILFLGLFILIYNTLPAVIILLIGLLPTITVIIISPKNNSKLMIIGCFNLAGVFICMMSLMSNFQISEAFFIVGNIFNLIIMLGSAAIGAIVYYELPDLFVLFLKISSQKRLKTIEEKLLKLSLDWGKETIDTPKE